MTELPMIRVLWADAHAHEGSWTYLHDLEDTGEYIVSSVGWLISESSGGKQDHVTLCQSHGPDDAADHIIHIPRGMVRSLHLLQVADPTHK